MTVVDVETPVVEEPKFWCDYVDPDTDAVCGDGPFASEHSLKGHVSGKHGRAQAKRARGEATEPKKQPADKKPTQAKAPKESATKATVHTDRTAMYTSSLAMAGLGLYVAIPAFDEFDLDVVNKGAPLLASALDQVGQQNKTVQAACDMILGGGTSGAYLQLILAALAIAGPIAANHGVVPASVGARFGEVIGAMPAPAPVSVTSSDDAGAGASPSNGQRHFDPATATYEEWQAAMMQMDLSVATDFAKAAMSMEGATVVGAPGPSHADVPAFSTPGTTDQDSEPPDVG